ncbi:MAG: amino acid permease [Methanospirillum sp.]|nr:amino acid permease [Methanospirillum sp.]
MNRSLLNRILLKRPIPLPGQDEPDKPHLKRILGTADLILMGLGVTIGTGIFVISGVASSIAGPGIIVSFLIASLCCLCVALCYAELAAMIPFTGSAYTYTYTICGEIFAWIIGWSMMLELTIAVSVIASGWSDYICDIFLSAGISLPAAITHDPGDGGLINLPAMGIIILLAFLLLQGVSDSARINGILVIIKLGVLAIFFWLGFHAINLENYTPLFPTGIHGVFSGAGIIIISYLGFEMIATSAEEVACPQKDLPRGLIWTIAICTVLYILTGLVLTGVLPYTSYEHIASPITFALNHAGFSQVSGVIAAGALIGITSGLLVSLYGGSRLVYALSRDGLLPPSLSLLNDKGIPVRATLGIAVISAVLGGMTSIDLLSELFNIGTLVAFISVASGLLIMRRSSPDRFRPFHCPLVPFIPILAILTCLFLILSLQFRTIIWFFIWVGTGLVIYGIYGLKMSNLGRDTSPKNE